jgi:hypothetical protein
MKRVMGFTIALSATLLWLLAASARADEKSDQPESKPEVLTEGVEVQTRGPVHEAFAQPVVRGAGASPIIKKKPPAPVEELPPEQKPEGERVAWIPGYWGWDLDRTDFVWVSGLWRNTPPDRHWVPGYWHQVENGWEWASGHWGVENQNDVEILPPPPDPIAESPSPAPDEDSGYAPGTWVYNESRYMWRPGFWHRYRPGWAWISSSYVSTPAGYVFVDGYWDYDFEHRGLLFAPVVFDRGVFGRRGWAYRPSYVVNSDFLMGALFADVASQQYYYGDYFDPSYRRRGLVSWLDFRIGDRFYDPNYGYYRYNNRNNAGWEKSLRAQYSGRENGTVARPPRTFAQQQKLASGNSARGMTAVTPLARLNTTSLKLQPVSQKEMTAVRKSAASMQSLSQSRARSETKIRQGRVKTGQGTAPAAAKFNLDRPKSTFKPLQKAAPPRPVQPKLQAKPVQVNPAPRVNPRPSPKPNVQPNPRPAPRPAPAPRSAPSGKPPRKP